MANLTPSRIGTMTFFSTIIPPPGASGRGKAIEAFSVAGSRSLFAGTEVQDATTSKTPARTAQVGFTF